jgi:hypothetical protein
LVQHTRADHVTRVTHAERERTVESWQCADLERVVLTDIIDDPNVARGIIRIDSLANNAACIVDAECSNEKTSGRCGLRNDSSATPGVDCATLITPTIHRADRNT